MKIIIKFSLVIICSIIKINSGYSQVNISTHSTNPIDTFKTAVLKVKGITCANDLKTIALNIEKLKGVNRCKTGKAGATSTFEISYNPILVKEREIIEAIENTEGCENPNDRPYKVKQ